jgi:Leucine-rich repeat (LRR) protein
LFFVVFCTQCRGANFSKQLKAAQDDPAGYDFCVHHQKIKRNEAADKLKQLAKRYHRWFVSIRASVLAGFIEKKFAFRSRVCSVPSLEKLTVQDSRLKIIPDNIVLLTSLKQLCVIDNLVDALPPSIGELVSLGELVAHGNRLVKLPNELLLLSGLKSLDLSQNQVGSRVVVVHCWCAAAAAAARCLLRASVL